YIVAQSYVDRLELIDGNLYLKETRLPVLGDATAHLKAHSNLLRLAIPALANGAKKIFLHSKKEATPTTADYEPTVQDLAEARRLSDVQGAKFLAVLVDDRGPEYRRDRLAIQERLTALGVPFIAVQDLLPGADWKRRSYPRDTHWNLAGHEAIGKALAVRVRERLRGHNGSPLTAP
ncbi:MAG: hypothetical protein ACREMY_25275, partial [bacterium]